jgi:transmembrane sensor
LIFRDRPPASAVDEIDRYRSGQIIITNTDLGRRIVSGTFELDKLDKFVVQVEQIFGAKTTRLPRGGVLMR